MQTCHGYGDHDATRLQKGSPARGDRHRRRSAGHHPGADPGAGPHPAAESAQEPAARHPEHATPRSSSGPDWPGTSSPSPASSPMPSRSSEAAARATSWAAATLAVLSWFALIVTPHQYRALLIVSIVINAFMVIASTVVGGYMVEIAQAISGSGRLTAIREFVQQGTFIIVGPTAGYLASIAFGWTAAACGGVMFLLVPATILFLHEQPVRIDSQRTAGQRPQAAGQDRDRENHVGRRRPDGAVLYRPRLFHRGLLPAAERTAHEYPGTGLPAVHRGGHRHCGRARLRLPVPPP